MSVSKINETLFNSTIFTQEDWDALYPETSLEMIPRPKKINDLILHYLIAQDEDDTTIVTQIGQLADRNPKHLMLSDIDSFNLTPLIIAVMKNRIVIVRSLMLHLKAKKILQEALDQTDLFGWTPLHHSLITSKDTCQMILKVGGNRYIQTKNAGSVDDIAELVRLESTPPINKVYYQTTDDKQIAIQDMSKEEVRQHLGLKGFRELPYLPKNHMILKCFWMQVNSGEVNETDVNIVQNLFLNYLNGYMVNSYVLREIKTDTPNLKQLELSAGENIPYGDVIGELGGVISQTTNTFVSFSDYFEDKLTSDNIYGLNSKKFANHLKFAQQGFPNTIILYTYMSGFLQSIVVAVGHNRKVKHIPKGDVILINWGYNCTKNVKRAFDEPCTIRGRDSMRNWFRDRKLSLLIKEIKEIRTKWCEKKSQDHLDFLKIINYEAKILFPLNFPVALLDLHFSGVMSITEWKDQFNDNDKIDEPFLQWHKNFIMISYRIDLLFEIVEKMDKSLNADPKLKKLIEKWFLVHLEKMSLMKLTKAMNVIYVEMQKGLLKAELWSDHSEEIIEELKDYDWKTDLDHPLALKFTGVKVFKSSQLPFSKTQEKIKMIQSLIVEKTELVN